MSIDVIITKHCVVCIQMVWYQVIPHGHLSAFNKLKSAER